MSHIESLLKEMTLDEKLGQLNLVTAGQAVTGPIVTQTTHEDIRAGKVGGVFNLWGRDIIEAAQRVAVEESRLGVPLIFGLDILHGHRTIFPIPLAEAGVFDPALWAATARAAALEAASEGVTLTFAPMLDVARDPRWGRIAEGPGEDPLVAESFAAAKTRGFQGETLADPASIVATAKHFCAGAAALAGRDYASADVSTRTLHEVYLPPFRAAVAAGCAAIMPAFHSLAGVPMTMHRSLLRAYLRRQLGFEGVLISDYAAVAELLEHGVAETLVEAAALALRAGVDMDMVSGAYVSHLPEALRRGLVDMTDIESAVRRVLALKERMGLFDDPYRRVALDARQKEAHRALALESARRSITLLKNNDALPLGSDVRRIALIGPLADARKEMLGPWPAAGDAEASVSVLEAVKAQWPSSDIAFHHGVAADDQDEAGIAAACALATDADVVLLCIGETAAMSGEAASRATLALPGKQRALAEALFATGARVVVVLFSGRPLALPWLFEGAQAALAAWFPGHRAGEAIVDILSGAQNPSGRLAVSWPYDAGQVPIFHAMPPTGRPSDGVAPYTSKYLDVPLEPRFPFGFGLSFSPVRLHDLRLARDLCAMDETVEVRVDVRNDGVRATEETLFLFIHDIVASTARPMMELKAWKKVHLAPGEERTVVFTLARESFAFPDANMEPIVEEGAFEIFVGLSAERRALQKVVLRLSRR